MVNKDYKKKQCRNVRKRDGGPSLADGTVDLKQLTKTKNRNKYLLMLVTLGLGIVSMIVVFSPASIPVIGAEPIPPGQLSFALLTGGLLGISLTLFFVMVWVIQRKRKRRSTKK